MSKTNVLFAITNGMWLIEPRFVESSYGIVARVLQGLPAYEAFESDNDEDLPFKGTFSISADGAIIYGNKYNPFEGAQPNSTAVIGVSGPIMKYDNCGDPGTKSYQSILARAKQNPNISSVVLVIDTPGGTVAGTQEFAQAVKDFTKPIVTFVDGMMASAGYWIGSGASEIIVSNETSEIGSIGTMCSFMDADKMWEEKGVKQHIIFADASKDKWKDYLEAKKGNYDLIKAQLNTINDVFLSHVKENRAGKIDLNKENVVTGKIYLGADSVKYGLADSMGSFEFAVSRAQALANGEIVETPTPPSQKSQTQNNMKKITLAVASFSAIIAMSGVTPEAGKETVDVELTDDLLTKMNDAISAGAKAKTDLATAVESLAAAETKVTETAKELTTLKDDNKVLSAKVSTLENPGATTTVKTGTDNPVADATDWEAIDNLPHNKAIDNNPVFSVNK